MCRAAGSRRAASDDLRGRSCCAGPASSGGRLSASAAASTPGTAASRSSARSQNALRSASPAYARPDSETDAVSRRSVSMPTLTRLRRSRLAVDQHGRDDERRGQRELRRDERAPQTSRRRSIGGGPIRPSAARGPRACEELRITGTTPPRRSAHRCRPPAPASQPNTGADMPNLVDARDVAGCRTTATSRRPSARDRRARRRGRRRVSTALSATQCCSSRPRDAPSALRMASSRLRASARATSRLIAFAQAISSTQPTAASTTSSVAPMSPTTRALRSCRPQVAFSS